MYNYEVPQPNATCAVCGKPYYRCAKCIKLHAAGIETWKLHCDTHNCYKIYMVATDYQNGTIPIDDAKVFLTAIFSENDVRVVEPMATTINAIMSYDGSSTAPKRIRKSAKNKENNVK